jgi:hypothetical protein
MPARRQTKKTFDDVWTGCVEKLDAEEKGT